ncbi:NADP-dependent oxidoreductase [Photobacterium atrarenae]|uniref:NADP-dependent oxidoreductase n=1 Tax=Photobacterium atrarenae TaxID=865757 RepID=A0ABY5GHD5_9GAMM|nr:NADP-dependent oxidoreductase [Photobacterium atrarenae]UTV28210.1 NADP-dependent oxidoreductase [Photobacterium atrarenae]
MTTYQQLAITRFGEPAVLAMQTQPLPALADDLALLDDQVLVKVVYAGVNPIDAKTRAGLGWAAAQNKDKLPWVPGYDIAGEVVASCEAAGRWSAGDRVSGFIGFPLQGGGYSEYVAVPAEQLSLVPASVPLRQAAALPLAGQTAWQALEKAAVNAGDQVLVLAGAGGVGHLAIQLAVARGAKVFASCSAGNADFVRQLGATALDYRQGPLDVQLKDADVLIDLMGGDVGIGALGCVKAGGRVVTVPTITAEQVCKQARQRGLLAEGMLVTPSVMQNDAMMAMLAAGTLRLHIDAVYPLVDGATAHQAIESGHTRGKIVLAVGGDA